MFSGQKILLSFFFFSLLLFYCIIINRQQLATFPWSPLQLQYCNSRITLHTLSYVTRPTYLERRQKHNPSKKKKKKRNTRKSRNSTNFDSLSKIHCCAENNFLISAWPRYGLQFCESQWNDIKYLKVSEQTALLHENYL